MGIVVVAGPCVAVERLFLFAMMVGMSWRFRLVTRGLWAQRA